MGKRIQGNGRKKSQLIISVMLERYGPNFFEEK
jgi:hypothetical protein